MAGGLLQLVAYGAQDVYLTGNPQITFFKVVYRRHTNFSIEAIKQTFAGTADFGQQVSVTIQRNADLISRIYFQTDLPPIDVSYGLTATDDTHRSFRWLNWVGHILLNRMTVSIGGHEIDKQYGEWLHIWSELTCPDGKKEGYAEMVGNIPKLTQIYSTNSNSSCSVDSHTLYIPLQFWFCRNPGLALPIIALQYHDITITLDLAELKNCVWAVQQSAVDTFTNIKTDPSQVLGNQDLKLRNSNLYVDYVYLDTDERRRFAQNAHEYLIETLQYNGGETITQTSAQLKLNFTHPVKELYWVAQPTNYKNQDYCVSRGGLQPFNYTDLWDYSGFTGTPDGAMSIGMRGGRYSHNKFGGFPEVTVDGYLNSNNGWATTANTITNGENAGYVNIARYTKRGGISTPALRNSFGGAQTGGDRFDEGKNPVETCSLIINGNNRFSARKGSYFDTVQPFEHHTNIPVHGINVYSFALTPEDHQPSGTCNFSKIDNSTLDITFSSNSVSSTKNSGNLHVRIYAINYNILRIMSGLGGKAYSN